MKSANYPWLVFQALYEILRYDAALRLRGSAYVLRQARLQSVARKSATRELEQAISDAVLFAACLYWKPVLCLQRSVCTLRLLRKYGADARLVIGYRPSPFFSHAWVQVDDRVVYGSPAYQKRLHLLHVA
ncbi:MAG TPA: lasso peptide biosynthesis B2 protein [Candidatus Acidoferrum sp.]|nr:lasso peptide biosynthesis B2 protein [Candidatus Acidoferrum sp.]